MGAAETLNLCALALLILPGVLVGQWSVWYPETHVCAVKGSTVVLNCTYKHPEQAGQVKETMWCLNHDDCIDTTYVCHSKNESIDPVYKDRAKCLEDGQKNCTLKVKNITDTDAGQYRFRFITEKNKWTGRDGVTLTVTELRVSMDSSSENGTIRHGDAVNLTCAAKGCSLSQSEFIWVKDKQRLLQAHSTLSFNYVSCRHGGNYSCALKNGGERSEDIRLDVEPSSCPLDAKISETSVTFTILGMLLAVLVVVLLLLIYIKSHRNKTPEEDNRERQTAGHWNWNTAEQGARSPNNISSVCARPVTAGHGQKGTSEEEEISYISIQFNKKTPPEKSACSEQKSHDEGVIYSTVCQRQ